MRLSRRDIERRTVIAAYAAYDCSKTGRTKPDLSTWDWSQADAIDREMKREGLKAGVLAGYVLWDEVEVTMSDLLNCAVLASVFPGQSRKLGFIELSDWKPDRATSWYNKIVAGQTLDETAPLILRPTVSGESPACWYIEDGSGRAIAFVANQTRFDSSQTLAIAYLGRQPDPGSSSFMQAGPFRELLAR
jgi:hypothetical protein